jgi:hypothetical protein
MTTQPAVRPNFAPAARLGVTVTATILVGALAYVLIGGQAYPTQPGPWVEAIIVALVALFLWEIFRSRHEVLALAVPVFVGGWVELLFLGPQDVISWATSPAVLLGTAGSIVAGAHQARPGRTRVRHVVTGVLLGLAGLCLTLGLVAVLVTLIVFG